MQKQKKLFVYIVMLLVVLMAAFLFLKHYNASETKNDTGQSITILDIEAAETEFVEPTESVE